MFDNEKIFNLFNEKFSEIIPDRQDGLVMFSLFLITKDNSEKESYSESEIRQEIKKYLGSNSDRDKSGSVEKQLQKLLGQNFIEPIKDKRIALTGYSVQLCNLFLNQIQPLLNPSEIEKILEDVEKTLLSRLETLEDFNHWFENHFTLVAKPKINDQITALDYQLIEIEKDFNKQFKTLSIPELIRYCNENLDRVVEDRKKLSKSFNGLDNLSEILTDCHLNSLSDLGFIAIKGQINDVIDIARFKLENTEERIAKIKKNVRGLFDIIDKKPFCRKLETFLDTVLETTISSNKTNRKDVEQNLYYKTDIILPEFVSPICIVSNSPDNFNYPAFYESFSNPKNQKVELRIVNKEAIQRARDKKMKEKERAVKIETWLYEILEKLKSQPEIDFSQLYFDVLNKEQDIETVVKGTEYILKKLRKKKFKIELSNEFIINENNANNSIWNIRIKNTTSN